MTQKQYRNNGRISATLPYALGAMVLALTSPASAQLSRDPWYQPFSANSIWNTPIGSSATYTTITLGTFGDMLHDQEYLIVENPNDPIRKIAQPGNPSAYFNIHVADGWYPEPYLLPYHTPNNCAAFLENDGISLYQFTPLRRDDGNGNGYTTGDLQAFWYNGTDGPAFLSTNLFGDGNGGEHAGSQLSCLGGDIRKGEFTDNNVNNPIKHAVKLELDWDQLYRSTTDTTNRSQTFRWPATTSDNGYAGYAGTNSALRMGSLLAVPTTATETSLALQTVPGKKLFHALQDFGGYIVDTSAGNNFRPNGGHRMNICFENGVETDFQNTYGYSLDTGSNTTNSWYNDLKAIYGALKVVDNNTASTIGGGGTPRVSVRPLNYAVNPSFEYDQSSASTPIGWTKYSPNGSGDYNACYLENLGVAHGGSYQMTCYRATSFSIQPYQQIHNLANGNYMLTAWVQSSGGLSTANMYAWRFTDPNGGTLQTAPIPSTGSGSGDWRQITISNIKITDGQCEIGFQAAGSGVWMRVDNVELYQSKATPVSITSGPTATRSGTTSTITWTTNIPSKSEAYYGTTPSLGKTLSSATSVTSHSITLTGLSATATYYYKIISTDGITSAASDIRILAPALAPTIVSFTPASGPVGTSVTITGTNLTGVSWVKFNGTVSKSVTPVSPTSLKAVVPVAATTGKISLMTSGGIASSASSFTVTAAATK